MHFFFVYFKIFSHFSSVFPFDPWIVYKSVSSIWIFLCYFITESSLLPLWLGKHFVIQLLNPLKDLCHGRAWSVRGTFRCWAVAWPAPLCPCWSPPPVLLLKVVLESLWLGICLFLIPFPPGFVLYIWISVLIGIRIEAVLFPGKLSLLLWCTSLAARQFALLWRLLPWYQCRCRSSHLHMCLHDMVFILVSLIYLYHI